MLFTDIAGERRFVSSIAKRLSSLGAITNGDRKTATGATEQLKDSDFDTKWGRKAVNATYSVLKASSDADDEEAIHQVDIILGDKSGEDMNVKTFFNRLLGLEIHVQTLVFKRFEQQFNQITDSTV